MNKLSLHVKLLYRFRDSVNLLLKRNNSNVSKLSVSLTEIIDGVCSKSNQRSIFNKCLEIIRNSKNGNEEMMISELISLEIKLSEIEDHIKNARKTSGKIIDFHYKTLDKSKK